MLHSRLSVRSFQILGASKAILWPKCLTNLVRSAKEELSYIDEQGDHLRVPLTMVDVDA